MPLGLGVDDERVARAAGERDDRGRERPDLRRGVLRVRLPRALGPRLVVERAVLPAVGNRERAGDARRDGRARARSLAWRRRRSDRRPRPTRRRRCRCRGRTWSRRPDRRGGATAPTTASDGAPVAVTPATAAGDDQLHVDVANSRSPAASTNTATKPPPKAAIAGGLATLLGSDETAHEPPGTSVAANAIVDAPDTVPPTTATEPVHASALAVRRLLRRPRRPATIRRPTQRRPWRRAHVGARIVEARASSRRRRVRRAAGRRMRDRRRRWQPQTPRGERPRPRARGNGSSVVLAQTWRELSLRT